MKVTALIMAGGKGERFWPRSRMVCPKQFIDVTGCGKTMLQLTVERILPLVDIRDIYIVTNERYKDIVRAQINHIPEENILCEPVGRNTAPCIGLGAIHMLKKEEDAVMLVLASDHLIKEDDLFRKILMDAINIAEEGKNMVTIGISPNAPETGYGYIKRDSKVKKGIADAVECFVEKPDRNTAERYLKSGEYFWNSGMFVWKASTILDAIHRFMPDIYEGLERIRISIGTPQEKRILDEVFTAMRSESIDFGIMEKAENVYVIPGSFGWDDVGSWLALERIGDIDKEGNITSGNIISVNTDGCIIEAEDRLVATVGLKDIVIVDTEDIILVGDKEKMEDIKLLLERLKSDKNNSKYL